MGLQRRVEGLLSRLLIKMDWSIGQKRKSETADAFWFVKWAVASNDLRIVIVTGFFANLSR